MNRRDPLTTAPPVHPPAHRSTAEAASFSSLSPELAASIARCRSQLRFIPIRALREARVLALLNEATGSDFTCAHLLDPIGNYLNASLWPLPPPWRLAVMNELGPALIALMPNSDLLLDAWDREPEVTFVLPEVTFRPSLLRYFICRPLKESHLAILGYPERSSGERVAVFLTREALDRPYNDKDLHVADQVCATFAAELSAMEPARLFMPRHPSTAEHSFALDVDFRPLAPSIYAQAVLALFYAGRREAADGSPCLPAALEADLRAHQQSHQRLGDTSPDDHAYAFSKNHLGRVLLVSVRATPGGGYQLTVHEDLAQHARLFRIKGACRNLSRDRTTVYITCLLLAEGVRDPAEIARRGGFAKLKESSAQKIINQAKRIVADA